jgi:hypothetical protein
MVTSRHDKFSFYTFLFQHGTGAPRISETRRVASATTITLLLLATASAASASSPLGEVDALAAAVQGLLASAGAAASDESAEALCHALLTVPTPRRAEARVEASATALAEDGGPVRADDARRASHAAAVLRSTAVPEAAADHYTKALNALEAGTHKIMAVPPLEPAGSELGASRVKRRASRVQQEITLRRRAEAARDAAEERERRLARELERERQRRRRAETGQSQTKLSPKRRRVTRGSRSVRGTSTRGHGAGADVGGPSGESEVG